MYDTQPPQDRDRPPGPRLVPDGAGGHDADPEAVAALERLALGAQHVTGFAPLVGGSRVPFGTSFEVHGEGELVLEALAPEPGLGTRLALVRGLKPRLAHKRRGELGRELAEAALAGASEGPTWTVPLLDKIAREGGAGARGRARNNFEAPRYEERPLRSADPQAVSADARIAGAPALGSIGYGRREATLWKVEPVDRNAKAELDGAELALLIHAGSLSYGRQVLLDLARTEPYVLSSVDGRQALAALACAQNVGQANREVIEARIRSALFSRLGPKLGAKFEVGPWIDQIEIGLDELEGVLRHRRGVLAPIPGGAFVLRGPSSEGPRWLCRAHEETVLSPIWHGDDAPGTGILQPLARLELLTGLQSSMGAHRRE